MRGGQESTNRKKGKGGKGEMERDNGRGNERWTYEVIGALIEVHRELGPGFIESVYHRAVEIELGHRGIPFESEVDIDLWYRGRPIGKHRMDLIIDGQLVVELKAVEELNRKHYAQVRSYLKATGNRVGLLANFSEFQLDPRRVELKH